jgi:hypothetical protein
MTGQQLLPNNWLADIAWADDSVSNADLAQVLGLSPVRNSRVD